jgi:hypothetical protein
MDRPDLAQTILEIQQHGEQQQRLGDIAHQAGLNERAAIHYARAKVARDEKLLLHGNTEAGDPEYCFSVQQLLVSADLYKLVKWDLADPGEEEC